MGTITWSTLIDRTTQRLGPLRLANPAAEARWLVEEVSGLDRAELVAEGERPATRRAVIRLDALISRRLAGEPIQYVLGRWGFRSLDLFVDRRVLVPRPETEGLVDHALAAVDSAAGSTPGRVDPVRVVDLGTGSGAVALAMAAERTDVEVWATDRSSDALAVARANLAGLGRSAQRVRLVEGHWFEALPDALRATFDVVASNPPYIADDEPLPDSVCDWEPTAALRSGPSGLDALAHIIDGAGAWLTPSGALVLELAPSQSSDVLRLASRAGYDATIEVDTAGRDRVLVARRSR